MGGPEHHGAVPRGPVKAQGLGPLILTRDLRVRVKNSYICRLFWSTEILTLRYKATLFQYIIVSHRASDLVERFVHSLNNDEGDPENNVW